MDEDVGYEFMMKKMSSLLYSIFLPRGDIHNKLQNHTIRPRSQDYEELIPRSSKVQSTYFTKGLEDTGGDIEPPPQKKQLIMRISDLECFSDEYLSSFIYNSYVDTFLHDLNWR